MAKFISEFGLDAREDLTSVPLVLDQQLIADVVHRLGKPLRTEETLSFMEGAPIGNFSFGKDFQVQLIEKIELPFLRNNKDALTKTSKIPDESV